MSVYSQSDPELRTFLGMSAVVSSEPMREVLRLAERAAPSEATVLISGESGSGKELIARAIHHYSLRASRPWVDVNCGALPEHLVESELFGYEKGAFSGADSQKPGLFELAHTGTLFLDEVGELEPKVQVKLLRVLDRVPYYRLGGHKKVAVDVRIVAATNQDLAAAVRSGRFRGDLYHRLGQVRIEVPPLRRRPEDTVALAQHFLRQQDPKLELSRDAIARITSYDWPGNVRELRNVIVSTAVLALNSHICASDLALSTSEPAIPECGGETNLEAIEREMIFKVLDRTGGHQQKAAELLGISVRTLSRKLKAYGTAQTSKG